MNFLAFYSFKKLLKMKGIITYIVFYMYMYHRVPEHCFYAFAMKGWRAFRVAPYSVCPWFCLARQSLVGASVSLRNISSLLWHTWLRSKNSFTVHIYSTEYLNFSNQFCVNKKKCYWWLYILLQNVKSTHTFLTDQSSFLLFSWFLKHLYISDFPHTAKSSKNAGYANPLFIKKGRITVKVGNTS